MNTITSKQIKPEAGINTSLVETEKGRVWVKISFHINYILHKEMKNYFYKESLLLP